MNEDYKKRFCETFAKRFEIDIENKLIDDYWFLLMEEKDKEIERLRKLIITLSKSIQELYCNEEELELLNNILGSDKE